MPLPVTGPITVRGVAVARTGASGTVGAVTAGTAASPVAGVAPDGLTASSSTAGTPLAGAVGDAAPVPAASGPNGPSALLVAVAARPGNSPVRWTGGGASNWPGSQPFGVTPAGG